MRLTVGLLLALQKLEGDYPSLWSVTLRESKDLRLCKSDQSLYVVQRTGRKPKPTDTTSQPSPSKKVPGECQALKAVLKVKLVSIITVSFIRCTWGEKVFYTHVAKYFIQSSATVPITDASSENLPGNTSCSHRLYWSAFRLNFDMKSVSLNQWLSSSKGGEKNEWEYHATYLPTWISFLSCKVQIWTNRGMEGNDSITSQKECQDRDYTKGKQKNGGNVALLG